MTSEPVPEGFRTGDPRAGGSEGSSRPADERAPGLGVPTRPALPTLQRDQRELLLGPEPDRDSPLRHGLREGFPTRRGAIMWYQAAGVRTLGEVDDVLPVDALVSDPLHVHMIVTGPARSNFVPDDGPVDRETAARYRRLIEGRLLGACNSAYNRLRRSSGEYVKSENDERDSLSSDRDLEPEEQEHIGMRPAFSEKDRQQAAALRQLWGGFRSLEDALSWIHSLNPPSHGAFDPEVAVDLYPDETLREYLLDRGDSGRARRFRERLAVEIVLPAFLRGISRMDAGELASRSSSGLSAVDS